MGNRLTTPATTGQVLRGWYGNAIIEEVTERATLVAGTSYYTFKKKLPIRHRILATSVRMASAVALINNVSTNTGTSVLCERFALCKSLPATGTSTTINGVVIGWSAPGVTGSSTNTISIAAGTSDTNVAYWDAQQIAATSFGGTGSVYDMTSTSDLSLYLIPVDGGTGTSQTSVTAATQVFNIQTAGTGVTDGYAINSTGSIDIQVFYMRFIPDPPNG